MRFAICKPHSNNILKDKKTSNAGTLKIHPLLKKNELLINSDSSINNILDSNIDNAIKISAKLKSEYKKNSVKKWNFVRNVDQHYKMN